MTTKVIRDCFYQGQFYKAGDVVESHDTAERFVRFGFAEDTSDEPEALTDEPQGAPQVEFTPDAPDKSAGRSKPKEA